MPDLDSMIASMINNETKTVFVRAAPRWRILGPIIRRKLKKAAKTARFDISYHSDYQLALVEWFIRNVVPRKKVEIVKELSVPRSQTKETNPAGPVS